MYGKTFTSLWEGSMVGQADAQLVFIFLFCHCDHDGFVEAHPAGIAAKTGIPLHRVKATIALLEGPDPNSRSKAEEGRRIIPLDGDHLSGWKVVNYKYYRDLRKQEDRREYQRKYWHSRKRHSTLLNTNSTPTQPNSTEVDVEVEVEAKKKTPSPLGDGFEEFWQKYPRKVAKAEAELAWRATKAHLVRTALMAGLQRWIEHGWAGKELQFVPHASTWLRGARWRDDPASGVLPTTPAPEKKPRNLFLEKMQRLEKLHEGGS